MATVHTWLLPQEAADISCRDYNPGQPGLCPKVPGVTHALGPGPTSLPWGKKNWGGKLPDISLVE